MATRIISVLPQLPRNWASETHEPHAPVQQSGMRNGAVLTPRKLAEKQRLRKLMFATRANPAQHISHAPAVSLEQRSATVGKPPRQLNGEEIVRHTNLSGLGVAVRAEALPLVLAGLKARPGQAELSSRPARSGRLGAMQRFLQLQSMSFALGAEDEDSFYARLAPIKNFQGNADELARRFYEASESDEALQEMLAGLNLTPSEKEEVMSEIRSCGYDDKSRGYRKEDLRPALRKALRLGENFQFSRAECAALLAEVQESLHELEDQESIERQLISATLNTADEAEQSERPNDRFDDYVAIVLAVDSWAEKFIKVLDRYRQEGRAYTPEDLVESLESARRAAHLDLNASMPSTDLRQLSAIIDAHKLIVRIRGTAAAVARSAAFIQRWFGRQVAPADLLRNLLSLIVMTYIPANECIKQAEQLGLITAEEKLALLHEESRITADLPVDVFADEIARQTVVLAFRDAIDMLADAEESAQVEADSRSIPEGVPTLIAPAHGLTDSGTDISTGGKDHGVD